MKKDNLNFNIFITFILLVVSCVCFILINDYMNSETKDTADDTKASSEMSDSEVLELGEDKYYLGVATLTSTSTSIDKVYDVLKTKNQVLTDQTLIDKLNAYKAKTYSVNSSATIVSNYDDAITDNFTSDFINNKIIYPNGFLGNVDGDYYLVKDKTENYFFKSAKLTLVSKSDNELHFTVKTTSYDSSCASDDSAYPSITCTDTSESDAKDFRLIKDNDHWKISELNL